MCDNLQNLERRTLWARLIPKKNMIKRLGYDAERPQENLPVNFDILDESFSIGRGPDVGWVLSNHFVHELMLERVSKIHCRITKDCSNPENPVFIQDLSRNGTFVNGEPVGYNQKRILKTNDVISLNEPMCTIFQFVNLYREVGYGLPDVITDKYYIGRQLGEGGQGTVRLVIERKTCEKFAMKVVKKDLYGTFNEERIMREGVIMDQLAHPNIIRCYNTIVRENNIYLFLDYMEGGDLFSFLSENKVSVETAKHFFRQMCVAVKYLHDQNITHRDIKPENILLNSNDGLAELKLADFGLSKLFSQDNLQLHTLCGSPLFMAPEISLTSGRRTGAYYTNKVDIWSLGVVLHAMFCPFLDETKVKAGKLNFQHEAFRNVPENAQDLIRKMLAVNSTERLSIHDVLMHPWLKEDNEAIEELNAMFEEKIIEPPMKKRRVETSEIDQSKLTNLNGICCVM